VALLLGSDEEEPESELSDVDVGVDVPGGGGSELSKSGGKIGAEPGAEVSLAAASGFWSEPFFFSILAHREGPGLSLRTETVARYRRRQLTLIVTLTGPFERLN